MYFQNDYNVTTTTNLNVLKMMTSHIKFDMVILDTDPSKIVETVCKEIREQDSEVPIILTYVYRNNEKIFDTNIRKYANSIFYKPFDLNEVSKELTAMLV